MSDLPEMLVSAAARRSGTIVLPWRFLSFAAVAIGSGVVLIGPIGWRAGIMLGFDIGALVFFMLLCAAVQRRSRTDAPRREEK